MPQAATDGYDRPMGADRVTLYERAGCHLCEEVRSVLDEMLGPDGYRRVDIDADDDLVLRYGFRIPVVGVNESDRLEAPINPDDLRALVARIE
jgi:hypothetical protein